MNKTNEQQTEYIAEPWIGSILESETVLPVTRETVNGFAVIEINSLDDLRRYCREGAYLRISNIRGVWLHVPVEEKQTMNKEQIIQLLKSKGYLHKNIVSKLGGIEVLAERRVPLYEFDYTEFVFKTLEGKVPEKKIHMLDPWTFTIECD
jgi:hypothetical protein